MANPAARQYLPLLVDDDDMDAPLVLLAGYEVEQLLLVAPDKPWHELHSDTIPRRVFEVAARPLEAELQQSGWVLVLRDVTLERENQARTQMQERLATVGQLAAGIAHDFNNIMAAVVVYTDLLAMSPDLSDTNREQISIIQGQTKRATSLIRQILDFSRRSVMEQIDLDLLPFIKELDKLLGRVLPETIRLELTYHPGTYLIRADPAHLQQVFMNLALNARDAMPGGGKLQFTLERYTLLPEQEPPLLDLSPGDWVRIMVRDTGAGIPQDIMPHVFDPFFSTKPAGQGTGLGLAQVYGIVKQHGGGIDVYSEVEKGTTFVIYLPVLETLPESAPHIQPPVHIRGQGEMVLLVEDDQAARDALQSLLENQNYRVKIAQNGLGALQIFEEEGDIITLIVSDVMMPEMGGVALYRALTERQADFKILFITGHPLDIENQVLLEQGRVEWLQKPFPVQDFTRTLRIMLDDAG